MNNMRSRDMPIIIYVYIGFHTNGAGVTAGGFRSSSAIHRPLSVSLYKQRAGKVTKRTHRFSFHLPWSLSRYCFHSVTHQDNQPTSSVFLPFALLNDTNKFHQQQNHYGKLTLFWWWSCGPMNIRWITPYCRCWSMKPQAYNNTMLMLMTHNTCHKKNQQ